MLILDLRWLLYVLLLAALATVGGGWWLARRRRTPVPGLDAGVLAELEGAPFGMLLLKSGLCRYANAQARSLLGLPPGCAPLPEAGWAATLLADVEAARHSGQDAGRYRSVTVGSGAAPPFVGWWVAPLTGQDLVFLLDLSSRRRAEEAARTFLNDLSHELRTPLATLLTHLEVLSLPALTEEARAQSVSLLKAEARRMARLVHQMLELGRLETGAELRRYPLDMLALAEEAVAQMGLQAVERDVALALEADTPLPLALGDADRLREVFLNLLDNAVRYSRPGDRVTLRLQGAEGEVRCAIQDTGPGIPAQHLPHLGRRFYRAAAPPEVEGSGLGLAMAAEILRRHGTAMEIESRTEGDEAGTCVSFTLPGVSEA